MHADAAVAPPPATSVPEPRARDVFVEAADLSNAELETRLRTLAGQINAATGVFLVYLGAFDLAGGWHGDGIASCAHWLSWFCGMSKSAAADHVRVARRLRDLPVMRQAIVEGRLSFSKVRALTRVATPVTEADLVALAVGCSAAQLDRICAALARAVTDDQAQDRQNRTRFSAAYDSDGMLVGTFCLPPEEGAVLMAAIDAHLPDRVEPHSGSVDQKVSVPRRDGVGEQPSAPAEEAAPDALTAPEHRLDRSRAAALIEVARNALAHPAEDGPAPTVTEVVIHLNGTQLDRVLAERATLTGTSEPTTRPLPADPWRDLTSRPATVRDESSAGIPRPRSVQVWNGPTLWPSTKRLLDGDVDTLVGSDGRPLETPPVPEDAVGWVEDGPGLALATIERLLCDASIRTRCAHEHPDAPDPRAHREPSRAQRRALWRRDRGCRAPGCTRRRSLHAHHIIPWWQGGPTTLANMLLLCSQHHHLVHEGGWKLTIRAHHVVLTSPDGVKTLVEAPRTHGNHENLPAYIPAGVDRHTLTGQQCGDPLDLDFAVSVIATNIELAERNAASGRASCAATTLR